MLILNSSEPIQQYEIDDYCHKGLFAYVSVHFKCIIKFLF